MNKSPKNSSPNIRIFLFCLFFASLLWMIVQLSKNYTATTQLIIAYDHTLAQKIITGKKYDTLQAIIEATGFQHIKYKYKSPVIKLTKQNIIYNDKNKQYWLPNQNLNFLKEELNIRRVITVNQDTIKVNYEDKIFKNVPIKDNVQFNCPNNYIITDIQRSNNQIEINGPRHIVNQIKHIATAQKTIMINKPEAHQTYTIPLQLPNEIIASKNNISFKPIVEKVTEHNFELPIQVRNLPPKTQYKIIPEKITLHYRVALSDYIKLSEHDFEIYCDANFNHNQIVHLPIQINQRKNLKGNYSLSTNKVQLIIFDL